MTLDEIENSLPNGFHDAEVFHLNIDYINRIVEFELNIWIGSLSSKDPEVREKYRKACLILSNFLYCVIEPPDSTYPFQKSAALRVESGSLPNEKIPSADTLPKNLPEEAFCHWFFVNNWNSFIFVAATKAKLEWKS